MFSKKIFFQAISKKRSSKKFLLVLELRSRGFYVQAYADDPAVLVLGADMLWIRGMAQKAINIAANLASEQELQFSSKKTEIVLFTLKRNSDLVSLSINGSKLELSKEARLLGATLDSKLTNLVTTYYPNYPQSNYYSCRCQAIRVGELNVQSF